MKDKMGREINYLRISITDRCNFRCQYCMPEKGVTPKSHEDILSFEEILYFVKAVVPLGISKVRITGGEPLVRRGVVDFVERLKAVDGIRDISMTTNAYLLPEFAYELKQAGLDRVNISLDSLKPDRFKKVTRRGELSQVLLGIKTALKVGLTPIKINCVVIKGFNDDEIMDFVKITQEYPIIVRFIELMSLGEKGWSNDRFVSADEMKSSINLQLLPTDDVLGAGPAQYYTVPGALGSVGFITPLSRHFCPTCNRIRLTADGKLKPCLESDNEIDIKTALRANKSEREIQRLFIKALNQKPKGHHMTLGKDNNHQRMMWQIGG